MEAFEQLVIKYKDNLIYFIYRYTKELYIAQDLAQDTFVELLLYKERYREEFNFKTFLFTIGRNKAIDYIRKQKKHVLVEQIPQYHQEAEELLQKVCKDEEKKALYQALSNLKQEYQVAIYLIDLQGMSYMQAAEIMRKTNTQIKVLIHRARKALEKRLRKEGYVFEE